MLPGKAYPELYQALLEEKIAKLESQFSDLHLPKMKTYSSPPSHFRMRAEFKIWQKDGTAHYAMYEPGKYKQPVLIEEFSIGSKSIVELMPRLINKINTSEILRKKLFQIEFLSSSDGDILASLIYHKPLDDTWNQEAEALQGELACSIIGRSKGQKRVLTKDFIYESFLVDGRNYTYQQVESSFTQPNATVCQHMLNWAKDLSANLGGDLLELYCGNANFTLPLSRNFSRVFATEVSKTSVKSAQHNIALNKVDNIEIARLSSEEFTQAMNKERPFRRLSHIDLDGYNFSSIFVDPPRAGLDPGTLALASQFDNIIYVSCNPDTLKQNLLYLTKTHAIQDFAVFDQFPYTDHLECGTLLSRN